MITYSEEDCTVFFQELAPLLPIHYEELCVTKDYELEPDYAAYDNLYKAGCLRAVTCRSDGELIGYIIFIVQPHLHYRSCITAFEDLYYVKKEYRKGRTGIKLFQYAEQVLKAGGINRIIMHTKIHQDHSRLFEYLGYKNTDKLFTKLL
jgi:GNAT superfamily N-acetyltransferase